jgi:hypothetical protein
MRYPSVESLLKISKVTPESAEKIREVLVATTREEVCALSERARAYRHQCYHEPSLGLLKMYAANELIGGYGVEAIDIPEGSFQSCRTPDVLIEYVNLGDTYTTTLIRLTRKYGGVTYRVQDWGTILERYL